MTDRIAIVGSSVWPTPQDVAACVVALPRDVALVTDDRLGVGSIARDVAEARGLSVSVVAPNRVRDGDAAGYRQSVAIVEQSDRLVAFATRDPKTKEITEGTALRITLAKRQGLDVEVIETPLPGRVCALIARLRHRYDGIRTAPTAGHARYRIKSAKDLLADLIVVRAEFDRRLCEGWIEIDETADDAERETKTDAWCHVLLPTYTTVCETIGEAKAVLGCL